MMHVSHRLSVRSRGKKTDVVADRVVYAGSQAAHGEGAATISASTPGEFCGERGCCSLTALSRCGHRDSKIVGPV
jgi:predicted NBD/HSP70 family sugar kinase